MESSVGSVTWRSDGMIMANKGMELTSQRQMVFRA
jgi:hypothetical protein